MAISGFSVYTIILINNMQLTLQEAIEQFGVEVLTGWLSSPEGYQETEATHWVRVELNQEDGEPITFVINSQGVPVPINRCGLLYSQIPELSDEVELTSLPHKTLLIVERERVGPAGRYHFVSAISQNAEHNGKMGYIAATSVQKFEDIPESLPMVFDTCLETTTEDLDLCDFSAPIWYETTQPFFNQKSCEYSVAVTTNFTDTGDGELQDRMGAQIEIGVRRLLEYYNKVRDEGSIDRYLSAFQFADASAWNLARYLKVLITIPAKYFDAIGQQQADREAEESATTRVVGLTSNRLEEQVDALVAEMTKWSKDPAWQRTRGSWSGPEPDYGEFSFENESDALLAFISELQGFFVRNDFSLRRTRIDGIEMGMTENYEITYITVNTEEAGVKDFKISLNELRRSHPFNYPRSMAYVEQLNSLSRELDTNKELQGGWQQFLEKNTRPAPEYNTAAKDPKKCRPTLTNPFKCVPDDLRRYLEHESANKKCGIGPGGQELRLLGVNDSLWNALQSGAATNWKDKYASMKDTEFYELEKVDKKEFAKYLTEASGPDFENIDDPSFKQTYKNTKLISKSIRGQSLLTREQAVYAVALNSLSQVIRGVTSKVKPLEMVKKYIDCKCRKIADKSRLLEQMGDIEGARKYRLQASALGCEDLCGVIPVLCSCLPFDFPPKLKFPNIYPLPTVDIMAFITAIILNAIINAIIQFLVDFLLGLLEDLLKCDQEGVTDPTKDRFLAQFEGSFAFDEVSEEQAQAELGAQVSAIFDQLGPLVRDTATLVTPRELCALLNGEASAETLNIVEVFMQEMYPEVRAVFSNMERVRKLYVSIGNLVGPSVCDNLADVLNVMDIEPSNTICEDTDLREDILEGRATPEQIRAQLDDALKCDTDRLANVVKMAQDIASGKDVVDAIIPNIFQTPSNPNGLIPREPPSVRYLQDITSETTFGNIERVYYGEMQGNVPSLITTRYETESEVAGEGGESPIAAIANMIAPGTPLPTGPAQPLGQGATFADQLIDFLSGRNTSDLSGDSPGLRWVRGDDENFIILELPTRKKERITSTIPQDLEHLTDTMYQLAVRLLGDPTVQGALFDNEKLRIVYNVCEPPARRLPWSEVRDGFSVSLQKFNGAEWQTEFNFNSRKFLDTGMVEAIEVDFGGQDPLTGLYTPTEEAFSDFIRKKWKDGVPQLPSGFSAALDAHQGAPAQLHTALVSWINEAFVEKISGKMAEAWVGNFGRSVSENIENLSEIDLIPDISCPPSKRKPGLLRFREMLEKQRNAYDASELENPERYIRSMRYALSLVYLRISIAEVLLNGIVPFSYLKVKDLMSSDLILRYFLNELKSNIKNKEFYVDMAASIQEFMRDRVATGEAVLDPITGETVFVEFGDVDDITFSPIESSNTCADPPATPPDTSNEDCEVIPSQEFSAEVSDGSSFARGSADKTIGYMEYVIREQFKDLSNEMEILFSSTVENLTWELFNNYIAETDVPVFADDFVTSARFSTAETEIASGDEIDLRFLEVDKYRYLIDTLDRYFDGSVDRGQLLRDDEFLSAWQTFRTDDATHSEEEDLEVMDGLNLIPRRVVTERFVHDFDGSRYVRRDLGTIPEWDTLQVQDNTQSLTAVLDLYEGKSAFIERTDTSGTGRPGVNGSSAGLRRTEGSPRYRTTTRITIPSEVAWNNADFIPGTNRPSLNAAPGEYNSLLEAVYDRAATWVIAEATETVKGNLNSAINHDFKYLQNGGLYTEKFVKITEFTEGQWEQKLASLRTEAARAAARMIRDRSPELRNIVNIEVWQSYINSLVSMDEDLDIFTTRGDRTFFNIKEFFQKWEFGERLMFAYPFIVKREVPLDTERTLRTQQDTLVTSTAEDEATVLVPEMEPFKELVNQQLKGAELPKQELQETIRLEKAYLLRESPIDPGEMIAAVAAETGISLRTLIQQSSVEQAVGSDIFNTWTVPLFSSTIEIQSENLHEVSAFTNLGAVFDTTERIVTNLFPRSLKNELENLAGEFNNLILPAPRYRAEDKAMPQEGDIKLGKPGLDSGYSGVNETYAIEVNGTGAPGTLEADGRTKIWIDSTGYQITDPENQTKAPAVLGDTQPDIEARINELSQKLFGWGVLDSYGWTEARDKVLTDQGFSNGLNISMDAAANTDDVNEAFEVEIEDLAPSGQSKTHKFYPIFVPKLQGPSTYYEHGGYPTYANRITTEFAATSAPDGYGLWLARWFISVNQQQDERFATDEVVPVGVERFQRNNQEMKLYVDPKTQAQRSIRLSSEVFNVWEHFLMDQWDATGSRSEEAFKEIRDWVLQQSWKNTSTHRGGLFLIYVEVSRLKAKLRELKERFGPKQDFSQLSSQERTEVEEVVDRIIAHIQNQMTTPDRHGESAISRCFIDGNPENTTRANRPFLGLCRDYERFETLRQQAAFIKRSINEADVAPPIRNLTTWYNESFQSPVRADLAQNPQFRVLFDYIFPMPRLHSLLSMYAAEHVSGLPSRPELYNGSKQMVETLFYSVTHAGDEDWWNQDNIRNARFQIGPDEWPIPAWLIVLMTPIKILQALFILVPPLKWILDMANWRPSLPPYKKKSRARGEQSECE